MPRRLEPDDEPDTGPTFLSTSERRGNGGRWWNEVWGKVTAGLLLIMIPLVVLWTWGKTVQAATAASELATATAALYRLPAEVKRLRDDVDSMKAAQKMTPAEVKTLAEQIAEHLKEKQRKVRP